MATHALCAMQCIGHLSTSDQQSSVEASTATRGVPAESIKQDPEAVSKIQEWMPPRNKEELQSFLGFANYYRDFIPFHAANVRPMQELLRKNQHFYRNEKHQEAFDSVRQALGDDAALTAANKSGHLVLDTDASQCSCDSRNPTPRTRV